MEPETLPFIYTLPQNSWRLCLYTVRNELQLVYQQQEFLPYYYTENIREGGYRRNDKVRFNQETNSVCRQTRGLSIRR